MIVISGKVTRCVFEVWDVKFQIGNVNGAHEALYDKLVKDTVLQ